MNSPGGFSDLSMSAPEAEQASPITSLPVSGSLFPYLSGPSLSRGAQAVIADLSNFVPLGCLCFEDFTSGHDDHEAESWQEVVALPVLAFDKAMSSNLMLLQQYGWIRVQSIRSRLSTRWIVYRIYLLYSDVGLSSIRRDESTSKLKNAVRSLLGELDVSPLTWEGYYTPGKGQRFDKWATKDEEDPSLFYVFNKLPSPAPHAAAVQGRYEREALEDILDSTSNPPGLRTRLYPYQRRSAGIMLQREASSKFQLDPRLETRRSPTGSTFFYDCRKTEFQRDPQYYETCRGGILAETMGLGKTVICLALIVATKNHYPKMPPQYELPTRRPITGSLTEMAISAINNSSIPWKVELERIKHHYGHDMSACFEKLGRNPAAYEIPHIPLKWNRSTKEKPPQRMTLASTTLIVVPPNLCKQWQSEITKHIEDDTLKVLVMDDNKQQIPDVEELRSYDLILFSRSRFQMESKHGADDKGRRPTNLLCRCPYIGSTRKKDCICLRDDDLYSSPLKEIHFKRIIVDEGHSYSHISSNAALVAEKLITADHRWVVSGTPAKDLLGVEVDMSATENISKDSRATLLEQRRYFSNHHDRTGAIESLASLASKFLKVRPWVEARVSWKEYMFRHEDFNRLTYSGFSTCLQKTLQGIVVKTQPDDVEKDIGLPPLSHKVVRLQPSFYDKLTANLFTLVLLANAVTSEREDKDYIFHRESASARQQLISNLRQSAFFWTGFGHQDVLASIKNSTGYLAKEAAGASLEDRQLLRETLTCTEDILNSAGWGSMSRSHELGVFIDSWPGSSAEHWAFDECRQPLMTGISQLLEAQRFVNNRLANDDPGDGLSGAGIRAMISVKQSPIKEEPEVDRLEISEPNSSSNSKSKAQPKPAKAVLNKAGIPRSSLDGEPSLRRRASSNSNSSSPRKALKRAPKTELQSERETKRRRSVTYKNTGEQSSTTTSQSSRVLDLPQESPYAQATVVGTSSAKMSYLISQILKYCKDEKILVFYQGDNIAYYIAQVLELFHIRHEIYAKSLAPHLKASYVVRFDQQPQDRVLLMDVREAAFGLNLSSASRIYFVNPVCRPDIEAQAIKRAHRIGQKRPVLVETLVLQDSIEEKMLERSKRMTRAEHRDAKALEDDGGIRQILQRARLIPVMEDEKAGRGQMAPLESAEQLWARPGWDDTPTVDSSSSSSRDYSTPQAHPNTEANRTELEDVTDCDGTERIIEDDTVHHPQVGAKRPRLQISHSVETGSSHSKESDEGALPDTWSRRISLSHASPHMLTLPSMANQDDTLPTTVALK